MGLYQQPSLHLDAPIRFDSGVELTQPDHIRLGKQLVRVLTVMADRQWWTVPAIKAAILSRYGIDDPEASVSAQTRNARKAKHGGFNVERRRVGNVYEFRLVGE